MKSKVIRFIGSTILICFAALVCNASVAFSAVTQIINYQGNLTDNLGNPVNDTVSITFSLYHVESGPDAAVWTETQPAVVVINGLFVVINGLFNVQLGADLGNQLGTAIIDHPVFLGVQVDADAEMIPRQQITAAGFAFQASDAARLNGLRANQIAVPAGAVMHFNLPSCPTGWSDFAAAQGRVLVGAALSLGGTVGTPLGNLENRTHNHSVNPAATLTTSAGSHVHSVNPPATASTMDSHNHTWSVWDLSTKRWSSFDSSGIGTTVFDWTTGMDLANSNINYPINQTGGDSDKTFFTNNDSHSHSTNIPAFNSASAGTHSHTVDIPNTPTTSTSATMPYIQLRICQKD